LQFDSGHNTSYFLFDYFSSAKSSSDVKPPLTHRLQPQDRTLPAPRY